MQSISSCEEYLSRAAQGSLLAVAIHKTATMSTKRWRLATTIAVGMVLFSILLLFAEPSTGGKVFWGFKTCFWIYLGLVAEGIRSKWDEIALKAEFLLDREIEL